MLVVIIKSPGGRGFHKVNPLLSSRIAGGAIGQVRRPRGEEKPTSWLARASRASRVVESAALRYPLSNTRQFRQKSRGTVDASAPDKY